MWGPRMWRAQEVYRVYCKMTPQRLHPDKLGKLSVYLEKDDTPKGRSLDGCVLQKKVS